MTEIQCPCLSQLQLSNQPVHVCVDRCGKKTMRQESVFQVSAHFIRSSKGTLIRCHHLGLHISRYGKYLSKIALAFSLVIIWRIILVCSLQESVAVALDLPAKSLDTQSVGTK